MPFYYSVSDWLLRLFIFCYREILMEVFQKEQEFYGLDSSPLCGNEYLFPQSCAFGYSMGKINVMHFSKFDH